MEIVAGLSGHWLEVVAAAYLIGMVLYGHYKGFIKLSVSALALLITLVAVHAALPFVTDWLKNDTPAYEMVKQGMEKAVGLDEVFGSQENTFTPEKSDEREIIEGLALPEQLKRLLLENNNGEVYRMMGVELFRDYISGYLADTILRIAAFVLLFLIVFILLHVAVIWLDLVARLPILSGLNKIAGAALGGAVALIFLWVGCLVATIFAGTDAGAAVMQQIEGSPWLSWLYDHNMLLNLAVGLLRGTL